VNTNYIGPTRQFEQCGTTRQAVRNILEAWLWCIRPVDTLTTGQRMFVGYKLFLTKIYVQYIFWVCFPLCKGTLILLDPRVMWEESQLSSVLDEAIITYVWPENISANWQVESVFY
jgi:hypothetical protein